MEKMTEEMLDVAKLLKNNKLPNYYLSDDQMKILRDNWEWVESLRDIGFVGVGQDKMMSFLGKDKVLRLKADCELFTMYWFSTFTHELTCSITPKKHKNLIQINQGEIEYVQAKSHRDKDNWTFKKVEVGDRYLSFPRLIESYRSKPTHEQQFDGSILSGYRWVSREAVYVEYEVNKDAYGYFIRTRGLSTIIRISECLNSPESLGEAFAGMRFENQRLSSDGKWYMQVNMMQDRENRIHYSDEARGFFPATPKTVRFRVR